MTFMPRRDRPFSLCNRCGENLDNGLVRWGLCTVCELELDALGVGMDLEQVDTTESEVRRALGVLSTRGQFLNSIDDPDESSIDPT